MSSIERLMERMNKNAKQGDIAKVKRSPQRDTEEEIDKTERAPKERPVCHLDLAELEKQGFLTPSIARSKVAEEYRMLKRPLLMNAQGKGGDSGKWANLIMIASSLPGEGKTFTTLNLALSIAMERDTTVLVIDSDVVKPSLTQLLGLQNEPGLIDVLLDDNVELGDVIISTDMPKLSVMPAGKIHSNSTELLASEKMERIAGELSNRYSDRIVLFDAPPLMATTEASVLAHNMGQILMVVETGKTPQHVVQEAIAKIDERKVIGMLLNKSRGSLSNDYYGSYYGYGQ
ncbi:MAG: tyrosine-protein kinase family protein [Ectothiorhodospiraceae bacterium]|nr:tyrosine-protein kinase family protein [Ectothiorhodospiraceae bacterium]